MVLDDEALSRPMQEKHVEEQYKIEFSVLSFQHKMRVLCEPNAWLEGDQQLQAWSK